MGIYASLHFLTKKKASNTARSLLTTLFMMIEMKSETTINTTKRLRLSQCEVVKSYDQNDEGVVVFMQIKWETFHSCIHLGDSFRYCV